MTKIEIGKTYKGCINGCLIKVVGTHTEETICGEIVMVDYIDLKNNKKGQAPLTRLEHSAFKEV